jgi:hypothetical protein
MEQDWAAATIYGCNDLTACGFPKAQPPFLVDEVDGGKNKIGFVSKKALPDLTVSALAALEAHTWSAIVRS